MKVRPASFDCNNVQAKLIKANEKKLVQNRPVFARPDTESKLTGKYAKWTGKVEEYLSIKNQTDRKLEISN
jgi:hypothetical protein